VAADHCGGMRWSASRGQIGEMESATVNDCVCRSAGTNPGQAKRNSDALVIFLLRVSGKEQDKSLEGAMGLLSGRTCQLTEMENVLDGKNDG